MGARTNFEFRDAKGSVWLYSHWGGDTKVEDLLDALEKSRPRWHDPSYAMRITISQLIGENWSAETGYGISSYECGEESYSPITIDFYRDTITYEDMDYSIQGFLNKRWLLQDA